MVIILFGVTGVGKTTIGRLLAQTLGWSFYDADQFHSPDNVQKMRQGIALSDEDRRPWLDSLRALISNCIATGQPTVLACSALKEAYRRHLKTSPAVKLVYLKADRAVIEGRLKKRKDHFMHPALLQSQLETLEPPSGDVLVIDASESPTAIVERIRKELKI